MQVDFVEWLEYELEISDDPLLDWERLVSGMHKCHGARTWLPSSLINTYYIVARGYKPSPLIVHVPLFLHARERYHARMLFDDFLGNGLADMESALCHIYSALTVHPTKPGFNNLIPLLHVSYIMEFFLFLLRFLSPFDCQNYIRRFACLCHQLVVLQVSSKLCRKHSSTM